MKPASITIQALLHLRKENLENKREGKKQQQKKSI